MGFVRLKALGMKTFMVIPVDPEYVSEAILHEIFSVFPVAPSGLTCVIAEIVSVNPEPVTVISPTMVKYEVRWFFT